MKDLKISKAIVNERDELLCNIICKKDDYTIAEWQILKNAKNNGDMLDFEIVGLVNGDVEQHRKKKLQQLGINMSTYCEKAKVEMVDQLRIIYKKYKVSTRKDMNIEDIEREIESYKMGIFEFTN